MRGFAEHRAALQACKARALVAGVAAVRAGNGAIVAAGEENAPKRTGLLASTVQQQEPQVSGSRIVGRASAGSEATLTGWPGNRVVKGLHGEHGRAGLGPQFDNYGYEVFQEFGTINGVPATHFMEDAVTSAMQGMGQRMASAYREAF